jgi:hypothetical protein
MIINRIYETLSMDRIDNTIKFVHIIWKRSHMNALEKYIYNETINNNQY